MFGFAENVDMPGMWSLCGVEAVVPFVAGVLPFAVAGVRRVLIPGVLSLSVKGALLTFMVDSEPWCFDGPVYSSSISVSRSSA